MADYSNFRQRLDDVLRTLDVKQVQKFLIAERQWSEGQPADIDFAMWMMIAGSPSLKNMHDRAYEWLMTHGHEADAAAFLARDKKLGTKDGANRDRGGGPAGMPKFSGKKSNSTQAANAPKRQGPSKGRREEHD